MTDAAIAAQIHQALNAHRDFSAQIAFDENLADLTAQGSHFVVRQIFDQRVGLNACTFADRPGKYANQLMVYGAKWAAANRPTGKATLRRKAITTIAPCALLVRTTWS